MYKRGHIFNTLIVLNWCLNPVFIWAVFANRRRIFTDKNRRGLTAKTRGVLHLSDQQSTHLWYDFFFFLISKESEVFPPVFSCCSSNTHKPVGVKYLRETAEMLLSKMPTTHCSFWCFSGYCGNCSFRIQAFYGLLRAVHLYRQLKLLYWSWLYPT